MNFNYSPVDPADDQYGPEIETKNLGPNRLNESLNGNSFTNFLNGRIYCRKLYRNWVRKYSFILKEGDGEGNLTLKNHQHRENTTY